MKADKRRSIYALTGERFQGSDLTKTQALPNTRLGSLEPAPGVEQMREVSTPAKHKSALLTAMYHWVLSRR